MKVFFDTNVYVAEALLGEASARMIEATLDAGWRIYVSPYVLDEVEHVIVDHLDFPRRLASLSRRRIARRATAVIPPASRHAVPDDPADSPILRAALSAGADYLVTNDRHLLRMGPYESLRIVSLRNYEQLLVDEGLLRRR
jgi:putative PIN family toxin of toxin-antitoxin system